MLLRFLLATATYCEAIYTLSITKKKVLPNTHTLFLQRGTHTNLVWSSFGKRKTKNSYRVDSARSFDLAFSHFSSALLSGRLRVYDDGPLGTTSKKPQVKPFKTRTKKTMKNAL
jgi:hypothetical protein